jgi:hypothetical protein
MLDKVVKKVNFINSRPVGELRAFSAPSGGIGNSFTQRYCWSRRLSWGRALFRVFIPRSEIFFFGVDHLIQLSLSLCVSM